MSLGRPEYVSDLIIYMLNGLGVEYIPLNPGATIRGIHESVVSYGGNQSPELITCCHEELAIAMVQGYYLATGRLQAAMVHDMVGLQHASKAIYEAFLDHIPMIILGGTGPMDASHRRPWIDWIHTAQVQAQLVRDFVKWDDQPVGPGSVVESILRAYQVAMTEPRGPVYLCFDVELQESRLPANFELPDFSKYDLPIPPGGNQGAVERVARALLEAEWPVLLVEGMGRKEGGPEALETLATLLATPVIERGSTFNLPNRHPLNVTGANAEVLRNADLIVSVGVSDLEQILRRPATAGTVVPAGLPRAPSGFSRSFESLIPEQAKLIRIGLEDFGIRAWSSSYGRLMPTDIAVLGEEVEVLEQLALCCKDGLSGNTAEKVVARFAQVKEIHEGMYARLEKELHERWWEQRPTSTARLAAEIWEAIKEEDWVLVHGSLSGWERRLWDFSDPARCIAGGGGTGTGMGVAMGAALAFRGTDKVCVSIQNDGDLLYTAGSLWTAAHHNIPMLVVMFNNRSYYQDSGHQTAVTEMRERSLENVGIGVDLQGPDTDFATLAKSFGLYGEGPILNLYDIQPALKRGIQETKGPGKFALIDTITRKCSDLRGSEQPAAFQEGIETSSPPGAKEGCQGHLAVGALP